MKEIYISVDIEADGPCPGIYSMLSFGAAAFNGIDEIPLDTFSANLSKLAMAQEHPDTMVFWAKNPEAYAATRRELQNPEDAMPAFVRWLKAFGVRPVFVGYPAAFDSLFVFWYLHAFAKENPFGWQALDIKTLAMPVLELPFGKCHKGNFPARWFDDKKPHNHVALDDAIEQGVLFTRIMRDIFHRGR
jgi:hypothetical protein